MASYCVPSGKQAASIIREARGDRSLREFAEELGNISHQRVKNLESGTPVNAKTLEAWWNDERAWVRAMARDILVTKFKGIRDSFMNESNI